MCSKKNDTDKIVMLILASMAVRHVKQTDLAERIGIHRVILNMFLNRKINLLPEQIDRIISELEIKEQVDRLSPPD